MPGILVCFALLLFAAVSWAEPVPDTGLTKCSSPTVEIPCPSPGQPFYGQDANYTINPMSYTKLDGSGSDSVKSSWVMVKDNVTGLIWEMKTNKDGKTDYNDPHDADNTYTWYDSNPATNGGYAGTPGDGTDTEDFIKALNDARFGGYSDWRLPTINELDSIVNFDTPLLAITSTYFPNTVSSLYWSSTTYAYSTDGAWGVNFYYGGRNQVSYKDSAAGYVRAVRGGQLQAAYVNNGNGTITDTSTGLMWQQNSADHTMSWEQALSYCENLTLADHTDWRLPTIKELRKLVDYSRIRPSINISYFPNTFPDVYWTSTPHSYEFLNAWCVGFYFGEEHYLYKPSSLYVRAVRGGQTVSLDHSVLSVSPATQYVAKNADTTTFSVSNTGTGTMRWSASIISGSDWLSITSGASGTDTGTINCSFTENTSTSSRTATIRITAYFAIGSPVDVTVKQSFTPPLTGPPTPPPTACTATLDGNLSLHIPYISYDNPASGMLSLWADFVYAFNPTYPTLISFKLTNADFINNPSFSCGASTLSADLKIHIRDVLLPDAITYLWVDLEYSAALSTDGNFYWVVSDYGPVSN